MSQAVERAEQRTLRSDELAPGTLREVRVEGRRVMLARLRSGEVVATGAACPHEAAPLAEGTMRGEVVDCPLHHYLFDLRTGRNLYPYPIYPRWKQEET
ncbi:MAG: Rieske (2Fe-2S) protein, partial [Actinomycetota bacterium]